jgi:hypothetical protein
MVQRSRHKKGGAPSHDVLNDIVSTVFINNVSTPYILMQTSNNEVYKHPININELTSFINECSQPEAEAASFGNLPYDLLGDLKNRLNTNSQKSATQACKALHSIMKSPSAVNMVDPYIVKITQMQVEAEQLVNNVKKTPRSLMPEMGWSRYFHEWKELYENEKWKPSCTWLSKTDEPNGLAYELWETESPKSYKVIDQYTFFNKQPQPFLFNTKHTEFLESACWMPHRVLLQHTLNVHKRWNSTQHPKLKETLKIQLEICITVISNRMLSLPSFWLCMVNPNLYDDDLSSENAFKLEKGVIATLGNKALNDQYNSIIDQLKKICNHNNGKGNCSLTVNNRTIDLHVDSGNLAKFLIKTNT